MIRITVSDEGFLYTVYHIVKAFFPSEDVEQFVSGEAKEDICLWMDGVSRGFHAATEDMKQRKYLLGRQVYAYLAECCGHGLSWGILTGVRPVKLAMQRLTEGMGREDFLSWFCEELLVSEDKAALAYDIAVRERQILGSLDCEDGYSLYVGVPFCPTVCSYCSFSSGSIAVWQSKVEAYLDALRKELRFVGSVSGERKLNTIYIGGGTPTTLTAGQLEGLLACVDEAFCREHLLEYTVEAGRPDSITKEKLAALKRHGVSRISVNPQTMQQKTLDLIGRRHSVRETVEAFETARELGFDNINMDLIAGLPGESPEDMEDSLRQIERLSPDSLTVHALAIKRAARMGQEKSVLGYVKDLEKWERNPEQRAEEVHKMISGARLAAERMGMQPYYLYRQKNIAGNFENVGYAKAGKAGIYNAITMEEVQDIAACGAGSVSKRVHSDGLIERCENVKDIAQYMERTEEMIERKRALFGDGN